MFILDYKNVKESSIFGHTLFPYNKYKDKRLMMITHAIK
jgi:hypothetical protein